MQGVYTHAAETTHCSMRFGVFMPPQAESARVPVLYWLSGLTCTEDNFIVKAGAQRVAAELGVAIVVPDTSPRGLGYPGEADAYDFGLGAGFYVDATEAPWSEGYRMYSYVTNELPAYVERHFAVVAGRAGIFGHSMGGHGALTIALKNPGRYRSVSAFAPIASPMRCPWGEKALTGYLGSDRSPGASTTPRRSSPIAAGADLRCSSTRARAIRSSKASSSPSSCARRANRRAWRSTCGCATVTTTATFSSRRSSRNTCAFTRVTCTRDGPDRGVISARRRSRAHPAARARKGRSARRETLGRRHARRAPWE